MQKIAFCQLTTIQIISKVILKYICHAGFSMIHDNMYDYVLYACGWCVMWNWIMSVMDVHSCTVANETVKDVTLKCHWIR